MTSELSLVVAQLQLQRINLERDIAGAAVAAPTAVESAIAATPILPGDLLDDVSRYLVSSASIVKCSQPREEIIHLAARGLRKARIPFDRAQLVDVALYFCPKCIAAERTCTIAADYLPRAFKRLADLIQRIRDADDALTFAARRLEGAAA